MSFTRGLFFLAFAMLAASSATIAHAKPFAVKVRGAQLRMGSYDLAFTFTPDGKSSDVARSAAASNGLQIGVRVRLHRKNALLEDGEVISANSIDELLAKPGLSPAERLELKSYAGMDERALQALQSALARHSDVTLSELERKAEEILDALPVPAYQRPEPVRPVRRPASDNEEQVLDFSIEE